MCRNSLKYPPKVQDLKNKSKYIIEYDGYKKITASDPNGENILEAAGVKGFYANGLMNLILKVMFWVLRLRKGLSVH